MNNTWPISNFESLVASSMEARKVTKKSPNVEAFYLRRDALARSRQLKEPAKIGGSLHAHDELLQLLALLFSDHIAAERVEFHRDLLFGHRIARIAFWYIDARRVLFAITRCDRDATRLKLWKERLELFVRDHFDFVHDRNQRLIA